MWIQDQRDQKAEFFDFRCGSDRLERGDWKEIQGLVLRRYPFVFDSVVHYFCKITDPEGVCKFLKTNLGRLTSAEENFACLNISLNVSFTYSGLKRLFIREEESPVCGKLFDLFFQGNFPAFKEGLNRRRARSIGDLWQDWDVFFKDLTGETPSFDMILSFHLKNLGDHGGADGSLKEGLQAREKKAVEEVNKDFQKTFSGFSVEREMFVRELQGNREHFGFLDGIAQPWLVGGPKPYFASKTQEFKVDPWTIILRDDAYAPYKLELPRQVTCRLLGAQERDTTSPFKGLDEKIVRRFNHDIRALSTNGAFAAFRVLSQDVHRMEGFVNRIASLSNTQTEWLQSKMIGRWKNGSPIVHFPEKPSPIYNRLPEFTRGIDSAEKWEEQCESNPQLAEILETITTFEYNQSGTDCPYGAHIRRANPRNSLVAGRADLRNMVRRNMSYGPAYKPENVVDRERGLAGFFICSALDQAFEHAQDQWMNNGRFTGLPTREKDPITGDNHQGRGLFTIPRKEGNLEVEGVPRFVIPKGGAYMFFPSKKGIETIIGIV